MSVYIITTKEENTLFNLETTLSYRIQIKNGSIKELALICKDVLNKIKNLEIEIIEDEISIS